MDGELFLENQLNLFLNPARIIIAGYSNSGKTVLCTKLIQKNINQFENILYCGVENHPLEHDPTVNPKLHVSSQILNPFDYISTSPTKGVLLILDDCFIEAVQTQYVVDAFTKGRHKNISVIFITQNLFAPGKFARSISLNCSHYILMRNRDLGQIETLGRQIFGSSNSKKFIEIYKKSLSYNTYGYLLIDLSPQTPEILQLRTNIVGETSHQIVFEL